MASGGSMRWISLIALALSACAGGPAQAEGEAPPARLCVERAALIRQLASKYEEAPVGIGLTAAGGVIELLTSQRGSTWTIIVTRPDGITCLFAAGEGWEAVPRPPVGVGL